MSKTYRDPQTGKIRTVSNDVQMAALKKLGYVEITAKDIEGEEELSVIYEPVSKGTPAIEPPALPRLTKDIPPGPTRDPNDPASSTPHAVTREDVEGSEKKK